MYGGTSRTTAWKHQVCWQGTIWSHGEGGLKSALVVQKEAAMAMADGADHKDLIMLAKLGCASHDNVVGPLMGVSHICLCTSMLAHDVPCTQGMH